jgi:hypothetical protein
MKKGDNMHRLFLLSIVLSCISVISLHGMHHHNVPGEPKNWGIFGESVVELMRSHGIIPIESVIMTTIGSLPQAMIYDRSGKNVLLYALAMGVGAGYLSLALTLPLHVFGLLVGFNPNHYPHNPKPSWRKPGVLLTAALISAVIMKSGRGIMESIR